MNEHLTARTEEKLSDSEGLKRQAHLLAIANNCATGISFPVATEKCYAPYVLNLLRKNFIAWNADLQGYKLSKNFESFVYNQPVDGNLDTKNAKAAELGYPFFKFNSHYYFAKLANELIQIDFD